MKFLVLKSSINAAHTIEASFCTRNEAEDFARAHIIESLREERIELVGDESLDELLQMQTDLSNQGKNFWEFEVASRRFEAKEPVFFEGFKVTVETYRDGSETGDWAGCVHINDVPCNSFEDLSDLRCAIDDSFANLFDTEFSEDQLNQLAGMVKNQLVEIRD